MNVLDTDQNCNFLRGITLEYGRDGLERIARRKRLRHLYLHKLSVMARE